MHKTIRLPVAFFTLLLLHSSFMFAANTENQPSQARHTGREVYDYYCFQCHGYTGNAQTIASRYLTPKPRNFTTTSLQTLSFDAMLDAVENGRTGTAMAGFGNVLDSKEIKTVVAYVRDYLMKNNPLTKRYHTEANSWPNHERFSYAFPFVTGALSLQAPWASLDINQRRGKQLYLSACISCHDAGTDQADPVWELRVVSFPPMQYSHATDAPAPTTITSLHPQHNTPTPAANLSERQMRGRRLYLDNCAHCHAPDGSAKNWVGGFLEPHAGDFRADNTITGKSPDSLRSIISLGVSGTSMPACEMC